MPFVRYIVRLCERANSIEREIQLLAARHRQSNRFPFALPALYCCSERGADDDRPETSMRTERSASCFADQCVEAACKQLKSRTLVERLLRDDLISCFFLRARTLPSTVLQSKLHVVSCSRSDIFASVCATRSRGELVVAANNAVSNVGRRIATTSDIVIVFFLFFLRSCISVSAHSCMHKLASESAIGIE